MQYGCACLKFLTISLAWLLRRTGLSLCFCHANMLSTSPAIAAGFVHTATCSTLGGNVRLDLTSATAHPVSHTLLSQQNHYLVCTASCFSESMNNFTAHVNSPFQQSISI
eukprot:3843367-Amphidinium_carterae.1